MSNEVNILKYIPYGKDNAVNLDKLTHLTGMNGREIRRQINEARKSTAIINIQDGKGYYRPTKNDLDEVKHWKKQEESRAKEVFASLQPVRKFIQEMSA